MVAISAPPTAKMTVGTAAKMDIAPNGINPRLPSRFVTALPVWPNPSRYAAPIAMNTMMAATLIDANQNSNSPYDFTDSRLISVITDSSTRPMTQTGAGIQRCRIAAPATASTATTITQKYQ